MHQDIHSVISEMIRKHTETQSNSIIVWWHQSYRHMNNNNKHFLQINNSLISTFINQACGKTFEHTDSYSIAKLQWPHIRINLSLVLEKLNWTLIMSLNTFACLFGKLDSSFLYHVWLFQQLTENVLYSEINIDMYVYKDCSLQEQFSRVYSTCSHCIL